MRALRLSVPSAGDGVTRGRAASRRPFRGTHHRERGTAIVEAAIIGPLFFFLVLGMMDGAYALFGDHVVRGAATAGGRTASALANEPQADFEVLDAVRRDVGSLGRHNLQRVVIYRASGYGNPPTASCQGGTPSFGNGALKTGACNVYQGSDLDLDPPGPPYTYDFCGGTSPDRFWCPRDRKTTLNDRVNPPQYPDYIGVWVLVRHEPLVGVIIGAGRDISHQSVLRIEPRLSE